MEAQVWCSGNRGCEITLEILRRNLARATNIWCETDDLSAEPYCRISRSIKERGWERLYTIRTTSNFPTPARIPLILEVSTDNLAGKCRRVSQLLESDSEMIVAVDTIHHLRIFRELPQKARVIGLHFFYPISEVPLVEVIVVPGVTCDRACQVLTDFLHQLGYEYWVTHHRSCRKILSEGDLRHLREKEYHPSPPITTAGQVVFERPPVSTMPEGLFCRICLANPIAIILLPCGHLYLCQNCTSGVDRCGICRSVVEKRQRAYIP